MQSADWYVGNVRSREIVQKFEINPLASKI